jgi:dimethylamine/trimethylamine dehydrogenase
MLGRIEPGVAVTYEVWAPEREEEHKVDSVVLCTQRLSNSEIYHELNARKDDWEAAGIEQMHLVGDAAAPRLLPDVIFDGHRLGREIDSPNPTVPLPFIRERRMWGTGGNNDYERTLNGRTDLKGIL